MLLTGFVLIVLTLSHCIGVVEHSELAAVFTAHSIGFVTLWMLANPFFGFVGYVLLFGLAPAHA